MATNVDSKEIHQLFGIPPNRASLMVKGSLLNQSELGQNLKKLGLTAEDLKPIDWRSKIMGPRNQQKCGDCWAMSSIASLTDRFTIQKNLKNLRLQPALLAQCVGAYPELHSITPMNQGCSGGLPFDAGKYFEVVGARVVKDSCPLWDKICPSCSDLPQCDDLKKECNEPPLYKAKTNSTKSLPVVQSGNKIDVQGTITNMKKELLNGPFPTCYFVPIDF